MANFFERRRIMKNCDRFWKLVENGDIEGALYLFDSSLGRYGSDVSKAVRVAHAFHRWLETRDDDYLGALMVLAEGERDNSQIVRALHLARRIRRETNLAAAVRMRDPKLLKTAQAHYRLCLITLLSAKLGF